MYYVQPYHMPEHSLYTSVKRALAAAWCNGDQNIFKVYCEYVCIHTSHMYHTSEQALEK